ncbi:coiled-coil domain-containing protein [Stieleria varia]|uniref:Uncharacterized protein n=1 Tax=Stieleria varia TaxID=2528005 RepID=A0A5C6AXP2_9BACT|nr:hypothetical protein [Stieleria varia]TWU04500.1 hypothetical protein Pla52n_25410 [Stieleria varia]
MSDIEENEPVTLLVVDHDIVRLAHHVPDWDATTLVVCLSEDPVDWAEVQLIWPRYQTSLSEPSADAIGFDEVTLSDAVSALKESGPWIVVDLPRKRVFAGGGYPEIPRDSWCAAGEETQRGYECQISLHMPPWWQMNNDSLIDDILEPRVPMPVVADPCRDVLWGEALEEFFATKILELVRSEAWHLEQCDTDVEMRYSFTVAVHRDWLMTPRDDLGGRMPRDRILPGRNWIGLLIDGQRFGVTRGGPPMPISRDLQTYKFGPMGTEEICMYFDLCREMIAYGWTWAVDHRDSVPGEDQKRQLASELGKLKQMWLSSPFEGGDLPSEIIDCERVRIPRQAKRGAGGGHVLDCDCPICMMAESDAFGPMFVGIDGHHLELDDEFAFSLCETKAEWESQQQDYKAFAEKMDERLAAQEKEREELGELASPWEHAHVNWDAMQFGPMATMAISFLLADMVSSLQDHDCPRDDIDQLNNAFREYRDASRDEIVDATRAFKEALEAVADRNSFLVSRSADLQSKLDELCRQQLASE